MPTLTFSASYRAFFLFFHSKIFGSFLYIFKALTIKTEAEEEIYPDQVRANREIYAPKVTPQMMSLLDCAELLQDFDNFSQISSELIVDESDESLNQS